MSARFFKLRRAVLAGFPALVVAAQAAPAQQVAPVPASVRFEIRPLRDGLVFGSTAGVYLLLSAFKADLPHASCAPCDAGSLPGIDRDAIGPMRGTPATLSDVTMVGTLAGAGLLVVGGRAWRSADAGDVMVFVQTLSAASAATAVAKMAFHRPRPVLYTAQAAQNLTPDNGLSFPSGHTTLAFAAAAASASILSRHGTLGRHRAAIVVLASGAVATGVFRVVARRHFPTDVLAGAALGAGIGWSVPALYRLR